MRRHMKLVRLLLEHAEAQCNGHWYKVTSRQVV